VYVVLESVKTVLRLYCLHLVLLLLVVLLMLLLSLPVSLFIVLFLVDLLLHRLKRLRRVFLLLVLVIHVRNPLPPKVRLASVQLLSCSLFELLGWRRMGRASSTTCSLPMANILKVNWVHLRPSKGLLVV
jgi:hypothetical protein